MNAWQVLGNVITGKVQVQLACYFSSNSSRRRCSPPQLIAEAHSLVLSLVRSSVWSHRQELYPHITACFDYASARVIVHFVGPQDEGMRSYLDTSPTEGQRPFLLYLGCLEAKASNLDISTILCDSGGNKAG